MSGIALVGILSGMIFGALALMLRPIAGAVIITPVIASPVAYLYLWRDALIGPCFFATNFNTQACEPTRAFFTMTLQHASDAVTVTFSHIIVGFALVTTLTILRNIINAIDMQNRSWTTPAASNDDTANDKPLVDNYRQYHGTPAAVISAVASRVSQ